MENTQVALVFTGKAQRKVHRVGEGTEWDKCFRRTRGGGGGGDGGGGVSQESAGVRPRVLLVPVAIREPHPQNLTDGHSNRKLN